MDGWTSLGVLVAALGVWLGYPLADPVVGLLITADIGWLAWQAGKLVILRILGGVDPEIIDEITHAAQQVPRVEAVTDVQACWIGHQLRAEVNIAVAPSLRHDTGGGFFANGMRGVQQIFAD